jgi:benzylsuccinate CoA-transferase BbsF subunit
MTGPLEGIRILDLSWIVAGPLAGRLLADYGADVIKVESRNRMDTGRANRIPLYGELPGDANTNPDTGGYFHDANASKRSCTINLATEEGRNLLRELVRVSDVTICNLGGDQYERWGIGYEVARQLNPGIIMVNMPTMESAGPRANWRGFGDMFVGISGLKSISGNPEDGPLPFGHQYADFSSNPFHAAVAIMAALLHRDRTGEGQFIEVSQYESTVAMVGPTLLEAQRTDEVPDRIGNRDAEAAPHNIYSCADDGSGDSWCAIAIFDDTQWQALVDFAGLEPLRDPRWQTAEGRRASEAEIDATLDAWTATWNPQDLAEALQERGVPAGPYQKVPDLVHRDPSMGDRYYKTIPHPSGREFLVHGNPLQLHAHEADVRRAPLIGEHTFEVLTDVLHMEPDAIADLAARGVLD